MGDYFRLNYKNAACYEGKQKFVTDGKKAAIKNIQNKS